MDANAIGVAGIVTAIFAPLVAVLIAQQLSKRDNHQRLAMDTFYRLTKDVDRLRIALISMQSHTRIHDQNNDQWDRLNHVRTQYNNEPHELAAIIDRQNALASRMSNEDERGIKWLRLMRGAVAALKADRVVLRMLFNQKSRAVERAIAQFAKLADRFDPLANGGRAPDYMDVRELEYERHIHSIDQEIELLWTEALKADFAEI